MKIKSLMFALFAAMLMFVACDVISEDDRLSEVSRPLTNRTTLLIEFTGNQCPNCPGAAMIADDLLDTIPNNVIVVGMHPAGLSFTQPITPKVILQSKEAYDYLVEFGGNVSTGLPVGVINCTKFDDKYLQGSSQWTAQVFEQCYVETECLIDLQHSIDGDNHTVTASLITESKVDSVSLIFWLLESNIVGPQKMSHDLVESYKERNPEAKEQSGAITNYVHNHVFRACLNGLWGKEIASLNGKVDCPNCGPVYPSESCTFTIDKKYVVDNCSVVAVLVDTKTKEVIQAAEIALGAGAAH
ncbi:MAG: Omp28-related outer membrane protein [Paludibacteraceae bacterium]|nr:Omp28-related outer membrane protein [Paludibacteraceae bacterium]